VTGWYERRIAAAAASGPDPRGGFQHLRSKRTLWAGCSWPQPVRSMANGEARAVSYSRFRHPLAIMQDLRCPRGFVARSFRVRSTETEIGRMKKRTPSNRSLASCVRPVPACP